MSDDTMDIMKSTMKLPDPAADSKLIQYDTLTPELLGELHEVRLQLKAMEQRESYLRDTVMRLVGKDRGAIQRGRWVVIAKPRRGSATIQWKEWAEDQVGPDAVKELLNTLDQVKQGIIDSSYVKVGKESISIEIVKSESDQPEV